MRTSLFAAACLLAAPAVAQERAPELPPMARIREALQTAPLPPLAVAAARAPRAQASSAPELPANFSLFEKFFTVMDALEIKSGDTTYGRVTERFWAWSKSFYYDDAQGRRVAEARARILALGSTVDVTDGAGNKIGTIKEEILKSLLKVWTTYKLLDANDRQVASSEKVELFSTEITLKAPDGRSIALLRRGFKENLLRFTDRWDVSVYEPGRIDSRLLVMITAFKTSVDNDRRAAKASKAASEPSKE